MKLSIHPPTLANTSNSQEARPAGRACSVNSILKSMKISFAVPMIVSAFLLVVVSASGAEKSPKLPSFPGQPNMSAALKQLTMAQEKIVAKPDDAVVHLKLALVQLEGSTKNRGSFRATAIRLTKQAIKHLEQSDVDTAKHEVAEGIENLIKAGEAGGKK